ncbi:MAG: insulinase family protein, partial [Deltaproteobacteria bacterium]|nr:insulinase family protein [Deltaproteobacteria bacterium]
QKHEDSYAIDVAAEIIGSGVNSRLYKRLKINEELVQGVSTYAMTPKEPGVFFITAVLDTKNIEKTISAITEEILRIGDEGPKHKELQKTKIGLESGFIYERETMQGKASQLGYYETTSGGLDFEKKYVSGLRQVSGEDVKRVIKKYLTQENMTISLIVAEDDKDLIDEKKVLASIKEGTKNYLQAKGSKENKATAGTAQKFTLPNGITLIVNEDHSNATVALYASFPGGLRFEDSTTNGTGNFMSSMLSRGTTKRTRSELAMELDMIAGGVRGFSGKNSSGVSGEFLSRFFEEGLALFAEVTLNPSFPNDEIERLRSDIIASIKRDEDYLPGYTFKLLRKAMYDKHPYRMHVKGSTETVSKISRDDLISHYKRIFNPEQMVFSVVGDVSTSRVLKEVTKIFGDFKGQKTELKKIKADPELGEIKKTGAVKDKEQTNIGIGFLGTTMDSEDQYPLVVLAEILSSQGGRLFTELRDKKSLAYAVSAFSSVGIEPGIFGFYIGCAPEKKEAAIKGILAEIEKVTRKKVTRSELKRAKNALLGGYAIGLQNVSNQASDSSLNELYGLGFDFYKKYPAKIEAVSRRDILKAAKKYLTLKSYAISVVGPSKDKDGEKKTTTTGERKKSHGHGH